MNNQYVREYLMGSFKKYMGIVGGRIVVVIEVCVQGVSRDLYVDKELGFRDCKRMGFRKVSGLQKDSVVGLEEQRVLVFSDWRLVVGSIQNVGVEDRKSLGQF